MTLLPVHRLLISFAVAFSAILALWGVVHGVVRHEPVGWLTLGLGAVALPVLALYLRKLYRNPPIR
jgi:hypothetical protein